MRIPGKRLKRLRWVHTDRYVVAVEVEMAIPPDDQSVESEAANLLHEVEEHAQRGDVEWLKQHGRVYEAVGAA